MALTVATATAQPSATAICGCYVYGAALLCNGYSISWLQMGSETFPEQQGMGREVAGWRAGRWVAQRHGWRWRRQQGGPALNAADSISITYQLK